MIVFKCISCSSRLRVSEDKAGKRGKCPNCSQMVRVPRSQVEADETEAHREVIRARKLSEMQKRRDADDDVFGQVMGEVLSGRPVRKSPVRLDPQRDSLGVDPPPAEPRSDAPAQDREPPPPPATQPPPPGPTWPKEADHVLVGEPVPEAPEAPEVPDEPDEGADPDALRHSAEAPSAPPMSWPADSAPADAAGDSKPGSDLDALANAVRTTGSRRAPEIAEAYASASDYGQTEADRPESPARQADRSGRGALAGTVTVKGSHGLLSLLVLLVVVAGVLGLVGWRNREHIWQFRQAITRCLPSVAFPTDGADQRATPGCLKGKILLCDESGAPSPLAASLDPQLIARSPKQVGTVVFIRRNDEVPQVLAFRVRGNPPARPPVGYEMCAVDAASGRRICADTVVAADDKQAVETLCRLIERSTQRQ